MTAIVLKQADDDTVYLYDTAKRKAVCHHRYPLSVLRDWLQQTESLSCPRCLLATVKLGVRPSSSDNDTPYVDGNTVPSWLKTIIASHYEVEVQTPPYLGIHHIAYREIIMDEVHTHRIGKGVLLTSDKRLLSEAFHGNLFIPAGTHLGVYTGKVCWTAERLRQLKASGSDKINIATILGEHVGIDGSRDNTTAWTAFMNHKWQWPHPNKELPPELWSFFCNCCFNDYLEITAIHDIHGGNQLTVDYGQDYWIPKIEEHGEEARPIWNFHSNSPAVRKQLEDLILGDEQLLYYAHLSHIINYSDSWGQRFEDAWEQIANKEVTIQATEEEQPSLPPAWLRAAIEEHYAQGGDVPAESAEMRLTTYRNWATPDGEDCIVGDAMWARQPIRKDTVLGIYGGRVIWDRNETQELSKTNDKLFLFTLMGTTITVDGSKCWLSKVNHQWDFPQPEKFSREARHNYDLYRHSFRYHFSNLDVSPDGNVSAIRDIAAGEELYFSYGIEYWQESEFKPCWDFSMVTEDGGKQQSYDAEFEVFVLSVEELVMLAGMSRLMNVTSRFQDLVNVIYKGLPTPQKTKERKKQRLRQPLLLQ